MSEKEEMDKEQEGMGEEDMNEENQEREGIRVNNKNDVTMTGPIKNMVLGDKWNFDYVGQVVINLPSHGENVPDLQSAYSTFFESALSIKCEDLSLEEIRVAKEKECANAVSVPVSAKPGGGLGMSPNGEPKPKGGKDAGAENDASSNTDGQHLSTTSTVVKKFLVFPYPSRNLVRGRSTSEPQTSDDTDLPGPRKEDVPAGNKKEPQTIYDTDSGPRSENAPAGNKKESTCSKSSGALIKTVDNGGEIAKFEGVKESIQWEDLRLILKPAVKENTGHTVVSRDLGTDSAEVSRTWNCDAVPVETFNIFVDEWLKRVIGIMLDCGKNSVITDEIEEEVEMTFGEHPSRALLKVDKGIINDLNKLKRINDTRVTNGSRYQVEFKLADVKTVANYKLEMMNIEKKEDGQLKANLASCGVGLELFIDRSGTMTINGVSVIPDGPVHLTTGKNYHYLFNKLTAESRDLLSKRFAEIFQRNIATALNNLFIQAIRKFIEFEAKRTNNK